MPKASCSALNREYKQATTRSWRARNAFGSFFSCFSFLACRASFFFFFRPCVWLLCACLCLSVPVCACLCLSVLVCACLCLSVPACACLCLPVPAALVCACLCLSVPACACLRLSVPVCVCAVLKPAKFWWRYKCLFALGKPLRVRGPNQVSWELLRCGSALTLRAPVSL